MARLAAGSDARDGLSFRRCRTTPAGCRRTLLRPRAVQVGETADSRTLSPPAEETSPTPERPQGDRRNAAAPPIWHPVFISPNQRRRLVYSKGEQCTNPNRVPSRGRRPAPAPWAALLFCSCSVSPAEITWESTTSRSRRHCWFSRSHRVYKPCGLESRCTISLNGGAMRAS
jgi:hypothetical protein